LPNRSGSEGLIGGILECVPNAQTRDEIGKATGCALKDYFIGKFGREDCVSYQVLFHAYISLNQKDTDTK
jgi:hypothetical protein